MVSNRPSLELLKPRSARRIEPLLTATAFTLLGAGFTVMAIGSSGRFLPHDERFLGMTAADLCSRHGCRIVHFMIHDRIAFGGAAAAAGILYLWLVLSPLRDRQRWAWRALLQSGAIGFVSFLAYLGYGYLDTWHGLVTMGLLMTFALGILRSRSPERRPKNDTVTFGRMFRWPQSASELSRSLLLATAVGLSAGGFTIMVIGMTCVFVPQDLAFIGIDVAELHRLNPRLVPLIAHDRAAFGGAVCACGVALFHVVRHAERSRHLLVVLGIAGLVGFGPAILVHAAVGYDDALHLAPAVFGATAYGLGCIGMGFRTPALWKNHHKPLPPGVFA